MLLIIRLSAISETGRVEAESDFSISYDGVADYNSYRVGIDGLKITSVTRTTSETGD